MTNDNQEAGLTKEELQESLGYEPTEREPTPTRRLKLTLVTMESIIVAITAIAAYTIPYVLVDLTGAPSDVAAPAGGLAAGIVMLSAARVYLKPTYNYLTN